MGYFLSWFAGVVFWFGRKINNHPTITMRLGRKRDAGNEGRQGEDQPQLGKESVCAEKQAWVDLI